MTRAGFCSGVWPYDNIIVWAHLFRGGKLPMVSFWPLIHGTVDARMACSGSFGSEH